VKKIALLFFLLAAALPAKDRRVLLQVNVFEGSRPGSALPENPPEILLLSGERGRSESIERQREQIRKTMGLEQVALVRTELLLAADGSEKEIDLASRISPVRLGIRSRRLENERLSIQLRVLEGPGGRELSMAELETAVNQTVMLGQNAGSDPLTFAITAREPGESPAPRKIEGKVVPPRIIEKVAPKYPSQVKKEAKSGTVTLQIVIDETGAVSKVAVLKPSEPAFDAAAREAVQRWKYAPATLEGKPVAVYATITIVFRPS
jgi:TonB family protein